MTRSTKNIVFFVVVVGLMLPFLYFFAKSFVFWLLVGISAFPLCTRHHRNIPRDRVLQRPLAFRWPSGPALQALSSPLKKWKEGVRSKFSVNDLRKKQAVSPKIGPDPDFFNGLLSLALFETPTNEY